MKESRYESLIRLQKEKGNCNISCKRCFFENKKHKCSLTKQARKDQEIINKELNTNVISNFNKIRHEYSLLYFNLKYIEEFESKHIITYKFYNEDYNCSYPCELEIKEVFDLTKYEEFEILFKKAENCIINFYNSDTYRKIKSTPVDKWLFLEDFLSFDFEGTKIFLGIDFAMKEGNKVILYDWKTGRERNVETEIQLACYSLFVLERWSIAPENIIARIYNLSIDKEDEFRIDTKKIDDVKLPKARP